MERVSGVTAPVLFFESRLRLTTYSGRRSSAHKISMCRFSAGSAFQDRCCCVVVVARVLWTHYNFRGRSRFVVCRTKFSSRRSVSPPQVLRSTDKPRLFISFFSHTLQYKNASGRPESLRAAARLANMWRHEKDLKEVSVDYYSRLLGLQVYSSGSVVSHALQISFIGCCGQGIE